MFPFVDHTPNMGHRYENNNGWYSREKIRKKPLDRDEWSKHNTMVAVMIILFTVFSGAQPEHVCHSLVDKGRGHFLTSSRGSAADGCVLCCDIYIERYYHAIFFDTNARCVSGRPEKSNDIRMFSLQCINKNWNNIFIEKIWNQFEMCGWPPTPNILNPIATSISIQPYIWYIWTCIQNGLSKNITAGPDFSCEPRWR